MNDIHKNYKVGILKYSERMHELFELDKFIPPLISKTEEYQYSNWDTRLKTV